MSKQIKIVHVSDDNCDVSLNVGSINGVQEGDKFLVYSLSDHEIVDPDTGESLGYLEFVKGTGEVVHVQDKMCTITSVTYRKPVAKKTIRKTTPSMTMWAGSTVEEIVQDDNREQIPFDNPHVGVNQRTVCHGYSPFLHPSAISAVLCPGEFYSSPYFLSYGAAVRSLLWKTVPHNTSGRSAGCPPAEFSTDH